MAAPVSEETLAACLEDPEWRLSNLYKIITKGDDDDKEGLVVTFKPNRAQRRFIKRLWHRNVILKARQLGFTTLICLMWLDFALFSKEPVRCGIIAQDRETAESLFKDKVKFAYDHLPDELRELMPLAKDSASELRFAHNGSAIRVATSVRGGTIHRLHISEHGKICAKYPDKAREIKRGSIPAVPKTGILVIESTAEGREGDFYDTTQAAMASEQSGKRLGLKDYRFHFFPWWQEENYRLDTAGVIITREDSEYFDKVESVTGTKLDPEQRAWWVTTRDSEFSGEDEAMWQEYPSYPEEAFQVSTEGCYYNKQIAAARKQKRVGVYPHIPNLPVYTFWDIGQNDETAIWCMQRTGAEYRLINYYEKSDEPFSHFVKWLQDTGYIFGSHGLPHDAAHKRQQGTRNQSAQEMLEDLGLRNTYIIPRISETMIGINQTRDIFSQCTFDEAQTKEGFTHLELYRKEWDQKAGCWKDLPRHDTHSNGADAFRQMAQAITAGLLTFVVSKPRKRSGNWRTR